MEDLMMRSTGYLLVENDIPAMAIRAGDCVCIEANPATEARFVVAVWDGETHICSRVRDGLLFAYDSNEIAPPDAEVIGAALYVTRRLPDLAETAISEGGDTTSSDAIASALHDIGIPSGQLGYEYLSCGIAMVLEDWELIHSATKGLYPAVAKKFGTTSSRVERAIRHSIETAWRRGPIELQEKYFGGSIKPDMGRPTNREFIAAVAEHIKCN